MLNENLFYAYTFSATLIAKKTKAFLNIYQIKKSHFKQMDNQLKSFFVQKNGSIIIDLIKISKLFILAEKIIYLFCKHQKNILFVIEPNSKKKSNFTNFEQIKIKNCFYLFTRWPGGFITNWSAFQTKLNPTQQHIYELSKKEKTVLKKQQQKLKKTFSGILNLKSLPDLVIFISLNKNRMAVKECQNFGIPVIALVNSYMDLPALDIGIPFYTSSNLAQSSVLNSFLHQANKACL